MQAFAQDNQNVEALLLKGAALLELKKVGEAIMHYREAHRLAAHRYECHKGTHSLHYHIAYLDVEHILWPTGKGKGKITQDLGVWGSIPEAPVMCGSFESTLPLVTQQ